MDLSEENLRKEWKVLTKKREDIDAELNPLRAELDALVAGDAKMTLKEAMAREAVLRGKIKELQVKLYPSEQKRAMIARALNGQTG